MRKEQSFILYILTALLALFLVSCSHTKYVEVPVETIKTEYIQQIKYDSIYSKDSIYIQSKGDTVYINKTNYKYKYLLRTDTICKIDSIPYPVRVEVEREVNKLKWYQTALMYIGIIAIVATVIGITIAKYKK